MKKWLALVCGLVMAVTIGLAEEEMQIEQIGMTNEEDSGYIYRYTALDGQEIIYTASCPAQQVYAEDVNFDGEDDLVALTQFGAANAGYAFFVSTEDGYQPVTADEALFNYQLLPELNAVLTWVDEGWAGSLCRMKLYVWEDDELRLIRQAVSAEDEDKLSMQVIELTGEETMVLWQTRVPILAEDAIREELENLRTALTEGLMQVNAW